MAVEVRTSEGRVAASTIVSCEGTPLRTAQGEFDGADLWLSASGAEGQVSSAPSEAVGGDEPKVARSESAQP